MCRSSDCECAYALRTRTGISDFRARGGAISDTEEGYSQRRGDSRVARANHRWKGAIRLSRKARELLGRCCARKDRRSEMEGETLEDIVNVSCCGIEGEDRSKGKGERKEMLAEEW
ncbi:uncharacterized protein A4U43_C01F28560 [Asparagus officinalis]|uniref:Uncharacterized protein n=1 Tax=Asparagus officinalis TaxID=4686 RepID=A0A5P1FWP4_ASPOF|nr:uncharacterized protein A4U43_C01F28560 [Asparagus officinalis]